ncbi:MAG TPA: ECF transporter S component [Thermoclostridium caenicola]|uniref:Uncharacterized membrane protein n=1 Tax=Thermoclostridium caenicola TaxID=659425 RepID=A0A1M6IJV6_9FIRM|nr:ECF transporter S component [Thermoclostridium caenicola]SHJ34762.1 Uncharacterized membrane protein [Thermoclostridium caenicola]HOK43089.1 ECF transporter S component [Thermoclostridium caenicola]HOP72200.1 ECF transporter S component [Thermoclostridium caenicola]HPO77195.1 ECF transporter S component [Thermoclostridium caenicola]
MVNNTRKYVLTGLMTALVLCLTYFIKVPVPYTSGYIHLGDSMIYLSVMILGPYYGAFASGVGSMLADLMGGYVHYAIPTLVIKSLMALCMGFILNSRSKKGALASVGASMVVWAVFCAGAILNLKSSIRASGTGKILEAVLEPGADAEAIAGMESKLSNLPLYLILGIAASILVLAVAAWFLSRKSGSDFFGVKAIIGMTAAGMCMVMGYFIVESFMYGPIPATFSIPPNLLQFFGGVLLAGILAPAIRKAGIARQS